MPLAAKSLVQPVTRTRSSTEDRIRVEQDNVQGLCRF